MYSECSAYATKMIKIHSAGKGYPKNPWGKRIASYTTTKAAWFQCLDLLAILAAWMGINFQKNLYCLIPFLPAWPLLLTGQKDASIYIYPVISNLQKLIFSWIS
jgi:hypothetical protein